MTTQHPDALRLEYRTTMPAEVLHLWALDALACIASLEARLEAIGAGGVSPLRQINQPEPTVPDQTQDWAGMDGATAYLLIQRHADNWADVAKMMGEWLTANQRQSFDAADVATASAQGFRDGVASVSAVSEPEASRAFLERALSAMEGVIDVADRKTVEFDALRSCVIDLNLMLFKQPVTHPSPPEGMVGRLQVYRCKIKSTKQIDKEIPREQQGWWADIAAGQKLLLRQAVQSDLDRCNLGGKRSRNPADYMCETQTNGSLVSKVALEYMNPEQNVFAAAPGPADGESNGN